jgi:hypothetical protein
VEENKKDETNIFKTSAQISGLAGLTAFAGKHHHILFDIEKKQ